MDIPTLVPVTFMVIGAITVLRAAFFVATKSAGRFRGDPFIALPLGFAFIYLGQYLLTR